MKHQKCVETTWIVSKTCHPDEGMHHRSVQYDDDVMFPSNEQSLQRTSRSRHRITVSLPVHLLPGPSRSSLGATPSQVERASNTRPVRNSRGKHQDQKAQECGNLSLRYSRPQWNRRKRRDTSKSLHKQRILLSSSLRRGAAQRGLVLCRRVGKVHKKL